MMELATWNSILQNCRSPKLEGSFYLRSPKWLAEQKNNREVTPRLGTLVSPNQSLDTCWIHWILCGCIVSVTLIYADTDMYIVCSPNHRKLKAMKYQANITCTMLETRFRFFGGLLSPCRRQASTERPWPPTTQGEVLGGPCPKMDGLGLKVLLK